MTIPNVANRYTVMHRNPNVQAYSCQPLHNFNHFIPSYATFNSIWQKEVLSSLLFNFPNFYV